MASTTAKLFNSGLRLQLLRSPMVNRCSQFKIEPLSFSLSKQTGGLPTVSNETVSADAILLTKTGFLNYHQFVQMELATKEVREDSEDEDADADDGIDMDDDDLDIDIDLDSDVDDFDEDDDVDTKLS